MPQIKTRVEFEYTILSDIEVLVYEPSKAIAKGAAIFAKMTSSVNGSEMGGRVIDCASQTYGFESHRGGSETPMMYNMIYKGTSFDDTGMIRVTSDSDFIPMYDDQTMVEFSVFESEQMRTDSNWFTLGNGEVFNGLRCTVQVPPEYLGKARGFRMWVTLTLDANNIIDITVRDRSGNTLAYASSARTSSEGN
jgi:molecular chaperone DnaK (HSP70)